MSLEKIIKDIPHIEREKIVKDLTLFQDEQEVVCFNLQDGVIKVPYFYGINELNIPKPLKTDYKDVNVEFNGELRPYQKEVRKEAITSLNNTGCSLISLYTGAGKTILSINIACKIKKITLIIVNRLLLITQWKTALEKFTNGKVVVLNDFKKPIEACSDFYIINGINIDKIPMNVLNMFGTVIVDECHLMVSKIIGRKLLSLKPRYLIGLSATPYRDDGLNKLLEFYFSKNVIFRKLFRKHTVYRINTGIVPDFDLNVFGKVDWNSLLQSHCMNLKRNEIITSIVEKFNKKIFLILTKRKEQGYLLKKMLLEKGIESDLLMGKCKYDEDSKSRVIIATNSKAGVGMDISRLDALIIGSDLQNYFIQYLGRVFRRENVEPLVFDLIDDNSILKAHWQTRRKIYVEHGGIIEKYKV
jgi:superfamily II DNA or RNA helicase